MIINDQLAYVTYEDIQQYVKPNYTTNIYIACFTTAHARLRLYDMLSKLGTASCYADTDSVIYESTDETDAIVSQYLGDSLGEWTNELAKDVVIDQLFIAGPKDYGFDLSNGTSIGKVKGFRSNADAESNLTNSNRKLLITSKPGTVGVDVVYDQFRIKPHGGINTITTSKCWTFNYDKRVIVRLENGDVDTLPYGW